MPSLITHNLFATDVYGQCDHLIGGTEDQRDAFILGNQGPDPLFYAFMHPAMFKHRYIGTRFHREKPAELITDLKRSLDILSDDEREIGQAYALGFLCHYLLDSVAHPLIYWNTNQLCEAGVDGLTPEDAREVHALIESDIDEVMVYSRTGETVRTWTPHDQALPGSNRVLNVVSKMYAYLAMVTYGVHVPEGMFAASVRNMRRGQGLFHSRTGIKRALLGVAEEQVRPHSFLKAMSHRAIETDYTPFMNIERNEWIDPFTEQRSNASFEDLYREARDRAEATLSAFIREDFGEAAAQELTRDLNFRGEPVVARLIAVE